MNTTAAARRILIIDDNEAIHRDFRKTLKPRRGVSALADQEAAIFGDAAPEESAAEFTFEIDSALQGQDGQDRVREAVEQGRPYSMAFVDMRMPPGWDGVQTIQALWQVDPNIQVVICTAYSDYSWEQVIEQLGTTDRLLILRKPFDDVEVCQLAVALTEKWLVTRQAHLKLTEMQELVRQRTAELREAALHDKLTGLPNRAMLHDSLVRSLAAAARDPQRQFALLFLDFDRFKVVNDSLGHEVGDLLLIAIAQRLRDTLRATDLVSGGTCLLDAPATATAARLGGDEFIVLLDHLSSSLDAARVALRLLESLSKPYLLKSHEVQSTASIGVTTSAMSYRTPEEMIRDADTAMYRAKAAGRGRYVLFDPLMHAQAMARLTVENDLRRALQRDELVLHYQPIVDLRTGRTCGVEALVRWNHPERGLVAPMDFIPLAEETGIIVPLGNWVLEQSCGQLARWHSQTRLADLSVSINVSRKQFASPELLPRLAEVLRQTGVNPQKVNLEITESVIMEDAEAALRCLEQVRRLGVRLHMDDFGTGYSSLSCLHRFPLNGLKIDRAFVSNLSERRDYAAVVSAIVTLAQNLKIELVAEGVERADQLAMLRALGCMRAQGYHFSRPIPAAPAEKYLLADLAVESAA